LRNINRERRFWVVENIEEGRTITKVLRRRFPRTFVIVSKSLETADPIDVVYPGNPDEYSDVVREVLVLLATVNGDLTALSADQIDSLLREALGRCFDDKPDEERLQKAVKLIVKSYSH
jgi:hypothetical protein